MSEKPGQGVGAKEGPDGDEIRNGRSKLGHGLDEGSRVTEEKLARGEGCSLREVNMEAGVGGRHRLGRRNGTGV